MKMKRILPLILLLLLSACARSQAENVMPIARSPLPTKAPNFTPLPPQSEIDFVSDTSIQFLTTQKDLAFAAQIDIPLPGQPVWVAGIPYADGAAWAVAFQNGSLRAYSVDADGYEEINITPQSIPAGMPLTIYSRGDELFALVPPSADATPYSPPVLLDTTTGKVAFIASNGDLVISEGDAATRLPVNALIDSRILVPRARNPQGDRRGHGARPPGAHGPSLHRDARRPAVHGLRALRPRHRRRAGQFAANPGGRPARQVIREHRPEF